MRGPFIEKCEKRTLLAGVTLFIPAWNGGIDGWIATQAAAITTQLGGPSQVPEFILTVQPTTTNGPLAASISQVAGTASPQSAGSGQILLVLNYDSVSTNPAYPLSKVAGVAAQFMENTVVDGIRFSELPLHEISISRGTGEADEVAKALGQSGIWVEQETYLDPHIVSSIGDAPNTVYSNVEFADEYWRTSGDNDSNPLAPDSYPVAGAFQSNIQSVQDDFSGNAIAHLGVAQYYTGTIDPTAIFGGDGAINSDWYGDGYPQRDQTGFYYSAIDGGTRPLSGVWAASGGTGTRTATGSSGTQWPNVSDVSSLGGSRLPIGQSLSIHYIQQDASNAATITFYLETNPNPYGSSVAYTLGSTKVSASSAVSPGTFTASTAGMAPGTYYICAEINDGQGRYRFADSQAITLTQPGTARVQLTGTVIGTTGSYNDDGTTAANAFDGNSNTYFDGPTTNGNWVGLDLGSAYNISAISFAPRGGFEGRMEGGIFQASNTADFSSGVVSLYVVPGPPNDGYTTVGASDSGNYRYVRYLSPAGSYGDIAEMQVFGSNSVATSDTQPPAQPGIPALTAPASSSAVGLTWTASSDNVGVDYYNVFRNNVLLGTTLVPSFTDLTAAAGTAYNYTVDAVDAAGNTSPLSSPLDVATALPIVQLSGTVIGTAGSYQNSGATIADAFDGNHTTFFDGPDATGDWVGLNLGAPATIDRVVFAPRAAVGTSFPYETRMVGGVFQASNDPTFATGVVTLATITATPGDGWNGLEVNVSGTYQYVRYVGPANSYCDVADLQFLGTLANAPAPVADTTPPTGSLTSAPPLATASSSPYSFTVTYTDNVAVSAGSLGNGNLLVTNGSGYSQLATLTSTGLTDGATVVATYSVPAPPGGWINASDGTYTVALQSDQVSDISGNFTVAAKLGTFTVSVPAPGSGSLSGGSATAASSYNLTTLGTADWAHWGAGGVYSAFDHKSTGNSQISNVTTTLGSGSYGGYQNSGRGVSWTDGTPLASDAGDSGYIWANTALGAGYSFTAPADTTTRTLYIYLGGYSSGGTLTATLSDGSASPYTVSFSGSAIYSDLVTLTYKAASANQKITISYTKTTNINGTGGSVDLMAAALAGPAAPDTIPPTGSLTSAPTLTVASTSAYSFTVTYADNVAVKASTLGNQNLLVTNGSGYSQLATLVSIGLTNGASVVATYSVPAPTGGWATTANGTYTVALQLSQVSDTSGNFAAAEKVGTFAVNIAAPGTGSLTGQQVTAAANYNLTTLGTEDWAHWGRAGVYGNFDHKATGNSQISVVSVVGTGASIGGYTQSSRGSTWTGGSPTAADTNDTGYIWENGSLSTGFSFTVPANTTTQTLYVYAGGYGTSSSLTAHLSDGSTPDYVVTASGSGLYTNFYTITFKAASAGQTLTITLLKTGNITGTGGSVDLIAAALA
jgi:hypothetical protein